MKDKNTKRSRSSSPNPLASYNLEDGILFLPIDDLHWSPIWDAALATFLGFERSGLGWQWAGKHDATRLAQALKTQTSIPQIIRNCIATALAPSKGWAGPVLSLNGPSNQSMRKKLAKIGRKLAITEEYATQKEKGIKIDAIAADICSRFGIERAYFFQVKKMSRQAIRDEFLALLGPPKSLES